ncbi:MAG: filamentous hemagglutinin N-terminal domain-containing protein [Nitrospirota bacterium]
MSFSAEVINMRGIISFFLFFFLSSLVALNLAFAGPNGGIVVDGSATIGHPDSLTTEIAQTSARAIINWNQFGSAANEAISFRQPSSESVALNRVTGSDPSILLGSLSANGHIFVVNSNGVYFGLTSKVNVGSLFVSTLGISDDDFKSGKLRFSQDPTRPLSGIVNQGEMRIGKKGNLVMVAPLLSNEGKLSVVSEGGVHLAAATHAIVNTDGEGLIHVLVPLGNSVPEDVILTSESYSSVLQAVFGQPQTNQATTLQNASGRLIHTGQIETNGPVVLHSSRTMTLRPESTITAGSGTITIVAGENAQIGNLVTAGGAVNIHAGGAIAIGEINATNRGIVNITSGGGITDNNQAKNNITAATTTLLGTTIGGAADSIETMVTTFNATSTNGGVFITQTDALVLGTVSAFGSGNDVAIRAANAITDGNGTSTNITAGTATLTGTAVGTFADPLETSVNRINVTTSNGGIFISEADEILLGTISTAGNKSALIITNNRGAMTLGTITAQGQVSLAALSGALVDGNGTTTNITARTATLTGTAGVGTLADPIEVTTKKINTIDSPEKIFINESQLANANQDDALNANKDETLSDEIRLTENELKKRWEDPAQIAHNIKNTKEECLINIETTRNPICLQP